MSIFQPVAYLQLKGVCVLFPTSVHELIHYSLSQVFIYLDFPKPMRRLVHRVGCDGDVCMPTLLDFQNST